MLSSEVRNRELIEPRFSCIVVEQRLAFRSMERSRAVAEGDEMRFAGMQMLTDDKKRVQSEELHISPDDQVRKKGDTAFHESSETERRVSGEAVSSHHHHLARGE